MTRGSETAGIAKLYQSVLVFILSNDRHCIPTKVPQEGQSGGVVR